MKTRLFTLLLLVTFGISHAQNEDANGTLPVLAPVSMASYTVAQWGVSQCGTITYNLGNSTSPQPAAPLAGFMNNDVWFQFTAVAEVAKIKVCNPVNFDVSIELWNNAATGSAMAVQNSAGLGQREVLCVSSLTVGTTYKVRVGRANGTGVSTFNIIYEHLGITLGSTYSPDPPGAATCYNFASILQRTLTPFSTGATRWKFVTPSGTVYGPYTTSTGLTYQFRLELGPEICETDGTLQVFVEIQATDVDCSTIWWGFSESRPITVCTGTALCPSINFSSPNGPCGGVICNIYNRTFTTGYVGTGFQYQYRFVTDNGQTEFITSWNTSPFFSTSTPPYTNYFRYGKVYQVYVRIKRCASNPPWCGPCSFTTCGFPYANIANINATSGLSNYCLWRNKSGPSMETTAIVGMDQYRFRLMPVDQCSSNPYTPTGAPITTPWTFNFFFMPQSWPMALNQVYILQAQCRVLPASFVNENGQTVSIPGQQSDWGWPCFVGFRNSSSPPAGSTVACCNFPPPSSMMIPNELFDGEGKWTEFYEWDEEEPAAEIQPGKITVMQANGNEIQLDVSESMLAGNGAYEIYALNGRLLQSKPLQAIHQNNTITVTIEQELPTGIYLITVYTPDGRVTEKFFVSND